MDLKYLPTLENRAEFEFAAVDDFTREAVVWVAGARTTQHATTFLGGSCARCRSRRSGAH